MSPQYFVRNVQAAEFGPLLLNRIPLLDVRAPIEFSNGSIPGAVNLPLLTDSERHQIGICYKQKGQAAAIELGHALVGGSVRAQRVADWAAFMDLHPNAVIYCFRGGLRSQMVQLWLAEEGLEVSIVEGGYRALRRFLIDSIESSLMNVELEVIAGPTGSGKTDYLKGSDRNFIDLEGLARHRGSAFGSLGEIQPTQINFENELALSLLAHSVAGQSDGRRTPVLIEDESRMIGRCSLPPCLYEAMQSSPKTILDVPLEARVENIFKDYILKSTLGLNGDLDLFERYRIALHSISRKLGGLRTQEILSDLDFAQSVFIATRDLEANRVWIRKLLIYYYDPHYGF